MTQEYRDKIASAYSKTVNAKRKRRSEEYEILILLGVLLVIALGTMKAIG